MSKMNKKIAHWVEMSDDPDELSEYFADFLTGAEDFEIEEFSDAIAAKLMEGEFDDGDEDEEPEVYE